MAFPEDALQILGTFGDNKRNLRALDDHRERIVPFVGAGLSLEVGYPTWGDLLTEMAPDDEVRATVRALLKHYKYEEAAGEIAEHLTPKAFRAKLKEAFDEAKLPKLLHGAAAILPAFASSLVLTTNLDRVLEHAYQEANLPFAKILKGGDLHDASAAIQRGDRVLLKLHGDYEDDEPVLTLKEYKRAYGSPDAAKPNLELPLPKLLQQALTSRAVLFLGCSLQSDRTVQVLARAVRGLGVEHFALLSEDENTNERTEELRAWNIKPLFFPPGQYGKIKDVLKCSGPASVAVRVDKIGFMVREVRARIAESIQARCGTIKVLDMEQPISLAAIYTDVNILEKLTANDRRTFEEITRETNQVEFDRFGLHKVEQKRVAGFLAVKKHHRLLIYGKPGAGKTTFLKRLTFQCMEGEIYEDLAPVFVTLREFADVESRPALLDFILQQIGNDQEPLIEAGRVLLLLDGLDEVKDTDFKRVRDQIEAFARRYPKPPIVMTCRIAAREYSFEQFRDVEMADFDSTQIEAFSHKWFEGRGTPERAARFLERLKSSKPLLELATKPLLLALLCLVFEARNDFEGSRGKLYQEGLDILLRKWDGKRGIERQLEVSLEELEHLLEELAFETSATGASS